MTEAWNARATYEDGFEIDKHFPYNAKGIPELEEEEQHRLEEWLLTIHKGCTWYTVNYEQITI